MNGFLNVGRFNVLFGIVTGTGQRTLVHTLHKGCVIADNKRIKKDYLNIVFFFFYGDFPTNSEDKNLKKAEIFVCTPMLYLSFLCDYKHFGFCIFRYCV